MKAIYKSLAAFQQEVKPIYQSSQGYGYKYASLGSIFKIINPLLKKHGLGFTQLLDGDGLKTIIFHIESGEVLESNMNIQQNVQLAKMNTFQVLGSAITYYRRYSLSAALGLITDSDIDACGTEINENDTILESCLTLSDLADAYKNLSSSEQKRLVSLKDELKLKLK